MSQPDSTDSELQIIGGQFRGRKLRYHGDPVTRPMKHRIREAIFNLVGTEIEGKYAIDVFAGTGALGLEALSRGASRATFIERHVPTARVVEENIARLGLESHSELLVTSAFLWSQRNLIAASSTPDMAAPRRDTPWLVFVSPPYAFYVDRADDMQRLVKAVVERAPPQSIIVVESDHRLDWTTLGSVKEHRHDSGWDVRNYPPAVVGIWRIGDV